MIVSLDNFVERTARSNATFRGWLAFARANRLGRVAHSASEEPLFRFVERDRGPLRLVLCARTMETMHSRDVSSARVQGSGISALRGSDRGSWYSILIEYSRREGAHMKAAFLTGFGGNEVVKCGDLPEPIRSDDAVLVEVHAAGVSQVDVVIRQGLFAALPAEYPIIMGFDMSGVVLEAPAGRALKPVEYAHSRPPTL